MPEQVTIPMRQQPLANPPKVREFWTLRAASDELLNVDLMRFLASAGIVLCHSWEFMLPRDMRTLGHAQTAGLALFVDLFFVLSGFVIAFVYNDRITSLPAYGRFLQRRVGRLIPLHWATLLIATLFIFAVTFVGVNMNHPPNTSATCLAKTAFLLHAISECGNGPSPNGVSWSISAEMAMYLLFPLFAMILRKAGPLAFLVPAVVLAICISQGPGLDAWGTYLGVLRAFPGFLLGMAVFRYRHHLARLPGAQYLALACFGGVVAGSFLQWHEGVVLMLAYGGAVCAIAADVSGRVSRVTRRFAPLGQLTYSLYMIHDLVVLIVISAAADKFLKLSQPMMIVVCFGAYAGILVAAFLSFKLFETPARRWIDGIGRPPRK